MLHRGEILFFTRQIAKVLVWRWMKDPQLGRLPIHPEVLFGQIAVEQGWAGAEQVQECLRFRVELAFSGISTLPPLGELLVQRGYLTAERFRRLARWVTAETAGLRF